MSWFCKYYFLCSQKVDDIERAATVVKELYDLIETYKVPTPPEDLAVYQVIEGLMLCEVFGLCTMALFKTWKHCLAF